MNIVKSSEFLRIVMWCFAAFVVPLLLLFGFTGILYSLGVSLLVAPVIMYITSKLAKTAGNLYRGSSSLKSERELLLLELEKIRVLFGRLEYDQALKSINVFVGSNPEMPEAHYLKAHILWEGFKDKTRAISCLRKAMSCSEPGSDYYKWAMNFKEELNSYQVVEKNIT